MAFGSLHLAFWHSRSYILVHFWLFGCFFLYKHNTHISRGSKVIASFPSFIVFRRSKAWDPFTRDWHQMTFNWTKSTTAPVHPDPLPTITPSSQHKPWNYAACCCLSNYLTVNGLAYGSASDGCVRMDDIRVPWARRTLKVSRQDHDHTAGTNS